VLFGDEPTLKQQTLSNFLTEALLNLRLAAEWSVIPHIDQKKLKDLNRSLPINLVLDDLRRRKLR